VISSEFKKEEYWLIKWPLFSFVLSLVFAGGLFFGLTTIDSAAADELRRARAKLDDARNRVDKIEEEEQTIIEYVGRYRLMQEDGVVTPEDRLQFQELLQEVRAANELSKVPYKIAEQTHLKLQYPPESAGNGKDIVLNTTGVDLTLPMLHEDDLSRLLMGLMNGPGVLQPLRCSIEATNPGTTDYIYLGQHFDGACSFNLYTFQLPPEAPEAQAQ
jgi:hypothetical protein